MTAPYSILTITIIASVLYLATYFLQKIKLIKHTLHKKIWNIFLLSAFLVTGLLGVFLTIQVNYKLKFPLIDEIMVWHVDFGIGMAIIGLFHFTWHFKYFRNILKPRSKKPVVAEKTDISFTGMPEKPVMIGLLQKMPILALGLTAIITQIILLREFMSVFNGNELVIGVIMANWMLLTGTGSYLGRFSGKISGKPGFMYVSLMLVAVLPAITVFLLSLLRNVVFPFGSMISIIQITYSSFVLLMPFCLLSGFLFTFFCRTISGQYKANLIGRVYSLEAIGSIAGGLLFNFVLVYLLKTFQSLTILMFINLSDRKSVV